MWIVFESRDGSTTVLSEEFGVTYHSKYGAVQESRHVFINEGLHTKCIAKKELEILEIGFGSGLNALLTLVESERLNLKIGYTAVEPRPLSIEIINQLNYCDALRLTNGEIVFSKMHQVEAGSQHHITDRFYIEKFQLPVENIEFQSKYDIVYYDAFAPNVQPELWTEMLMKKMFDLLLPGGILVTYCAKGDFKRTLKAVGFKVETLKGPPGKREMVRAKKQ